MTVFKGVLLHFWRYKIIIIIFTVIFIVMAVLFSRNDESQYATSELSINVIDQADNEVSQGLIEYLAANNEVTVIEGNEVDIQEEILLNTIHGGVIIPSDVEEKFLEDERAIRIIRDERNPGSIQLNNLVMKYFRYLDAFYVQTGEIDPGAVIETAAERVEVTMVNTDQRASNTNHESMNIYMNFMGYILLFAILLTVGNVLSDMNKPPVQNRTAVSPVKESSIAAQKIGAQLFVSVLISLALFGVGLYLNNTSGVPLGQMLIATLTIPILGLSIMYLVSAISNNKYIVNGLANVIVLSLAFLSGIFIPLEFFGEGAQSIARLLPLYHYIRIYSPEDVTFLSAFPSLLVVLLYSACMVILGIVINRNRGFRV